MTLPKIKIILISFQKLSLSPIPHRCCLMERKGVSMPSISRKKFEVLLEICNARSCGASSVHLSLYLRHEGERKDAIAFCLVSLPRNRDRCNFDIRVRYQPGGS